MFLSFAQLRGHLNRVLADRAAQGHMVRGLADELAIVPDSYDAFHAFARRLAALPLREDWPYVEPDDLDTILAECDPARPRGAVGTLTTGEATRRIEAAFVGSVCGCILGKPLEINPTLAEIQRSLELSGDWPLNDYISERAAAGFDRPLHPDWTVSVRECIRYVAPDDDLNYTILGMLLMEQYGTDFTKQDICATWLKLLPPHWTWGPERTLLSTAALSSLGDYMTASPTTSDLDTWVRILNPGDELCGAMIRVDAYGYACAGRPALAAELAWRDASWTHRRTGVYGAMFMAAALAAAPVAREPLDMFETALRFVPRRSRFYRIVSDSLDQVAKASDWLDGYARIHGRYTEYAHCRVYQETGTLINTLRFADNVGDGICKQVSQGNDTDSYGARAGALLGAYFGPGHLEVRWLAPFNDEIRTALAGFPERSLTALACRMGALPRRVGAIVAREARETGA